MAYTFGEKVPKDTRQDARLLPKIEGRTRPRFSLVVDPDEWEWMPKLERYLPQLSRMPHDPGVGGVGWDQKAKRVTLGPAVEYHRSLGRLVFHDGDPMLCGGPLGEDGEFLSRAKSATGRYAYFYVWEGFDWVKKKPVWGADEELRDEFRAWLVTSRIVQPMGRLLKLDRIRFWESKVRRQTAASEKKPDNSGLAARLKGSETMLEALRKDLGETTEAVQIRRQTPKRARKVTTEKVQAPPALCVEPLCDKPIRWGERCTAHHRAWKASQAEAENQEIVNA